MDRKFVWDMWNFDFEGLAYVISADACRKEDVPGFIVKNDGLSEDVLNPSYEDYLCTESVQEGWCKYQVRSDWENEGGAHGGYVAQIASHDSETFKGKRGWFPVWIVRLGEWY